MAKAEIIFAGSAGFLAGVFSFGYDIPRGFIFGLVFAVAFAAWFLKKSLWVFLVVPAVFIGVWYGAFHERLAEDATRGIQYGFPTNVTGIITSDPIRVEGGSTSFNVELRGSTSGKIKVITQGEFQYGETISADGTIEAPQKRFGLPTLLFPKAITVLNTGGGNTIRKNLLQFKARTATVFERYIAGDKAAFLSGITLGNRSGYSREFKNAMKSSGTTHLVALSGYNIAILVSVLYAALLPFFSRNVTFAATFLCIGLFVAMVGGDPSIVRAAAMGFLVLLARHVGRLYSFGNAVVLTALFMTLMDPSTLFSLGFQLSFVSLLGITYIAPAIKRTLERFFGEEKKRFPWRQATAESIGAQMAVFPILVSATGTAPLFSFIPNILILPFIPLTMFLGFLTSVFGLIFLPLAFPLALVTKIFLSYEIGIIRAFGALPGNSVGTRFSTLISVFYFAFIALWLWRRSPSVHEQKRKRL